MSGLNDYRLEDMRMHESIVENVDLQGMRSGHALFPQKMEDPIREPKTAQIDSQQSRQPAKARQNPPIKEPQPKGSITIQTYNKEEAPWWKSIFPCLSPPVEVGPEFEECERCRRRVGVGKESESSESEPYMSQQRMGRREKQAVSVFYDRLKNNSLMKTSWE